MSEQVNVTLGGQEVSVIIEGGALGPGMSAALQELNAAVAAAELAETNAEAAAQTAINATANKLNLDAGNIAGSAAAFRANTQTVYAVDGFMDRLGIGTTGITDPTAMLRVETFDSPTTLQGISVKHYDQNTGGYGVDIRQFPNANTALVIHCYSDMNGAPDGGTAMQIDHIQNGTMLRLKNSRNLLVDPTTEGTAAYLSLEGFENPGDALPKTMAVWTHDNNIVLGVASKPLTFSGAGLVINGSGASARCLEINMASTTAYGETISAAKFGLNVSVTGNDGIGVYVEKSASGFGDAVTIKNFGSGFTLSCLNSVGAQTAGITATGNYVGANYFIAAGGALYVNATKVVGSRITGWTLDTGTPKRTANTTYTAGAAITAPTGGATIDAESRTAIGTLITRIAAMETALQNATQTIMALKNDIHSTNGHGLIGP